MLGEFQSQWRSKLAWFNGSTTAVSLTCAGRGPGGDVKHSLTCVADPTFGVIVCDGGYTWWEARLAVPGFGDAVRIHIHVPNPTPRPAKAKESTVPLPPTEAQRKALLALLDNPARYRQIVEDINWRFYTAMRRELLDEDDPDSRRLLPNIQQPAGVWRLLSDFSITVPMQPKRGRWPIELHWECHWDPEPGHKVVLLNGKENYVGSQGGD